MLMNVDLVSAVRRQIPVLLDKMISVSVFITGRHKLIYIFKHYT